MNSRNSPSMIVVQNINRCWNLKGSNRQICSVNFKKPNSNNIMNGLVSFSTNSADPEVKSPFGIENCDPSKEICDVPLYHPFMPKVQRNKR